MQRRKLRRLISTPAGYASTAQYESCIKALNILQLKLEHLKRISKTKPSYLVALDKENSASKNTNYDSGFGYTTFEKAEEYLSNIIEEYECNAFSVEYDNTKLRITSDSATYQFAEPHKNNEEKNNTNIEVEFFTPMNNLMRAVSLLLAEK